MDDLFARIASLTSYIRRQLLLYFEDLLFGDLDRCPHVSDVSPWGFHSNSSFSSSCHYVPDDSVVSSSILTRGGESLPVPEKRLKRTKRSVLVNICSETLDTNDCILSFSAGPSIFQGLMLPLYGARLAWKLTVAFWRHFLCHVRRVEAQVRSLVFRVQKTLHGSSGDIGWLQRTPGVPPVEDGTARFIELLEGIRNGKHVLPNSYVYLLIPGLFSNLSPLYFVSTKRFFSKMGLACHIAKIHSEAAVEHNAWELKQYIEELYWGSGKRVMLLGHSKGGVDAAAALSLYSSELQGKVAGLALVQSPYAGTPIASDILREGQIADKETRKIMEIVICKLIKGDMRALEDLTYEKRKEFIMNNKLPENIPLISFHSEASTGPGVIATMSLIAHAELPWLPNFYEFGYKIPVVVPVAAAMAVSALHLKLRYGEKSDGLVTCRDAEVPGSVVVHPDKRLDHAWMVYSTWRKDSSEPDSSEMCEALLTLLVELGNKVEEKQ
ncbi:hypothetical protein ACHQM5_002086 [Ranunculus cassubicifolius]